MTEYLSPSIGQVMPQLDQLCEELTRQSLIRALTDYTKELCEYDPELADILLEGKKTLPRCIRYVTEQTQKVAEKQAEAKTAKEMTELSRTTIHGLTASVMGIAISDQEVYKWVKAYYYGGDQVEPTDLTARTPAKSSAGKGKTKNSDAGKDKKAAPSAVKKDSDPTKPADAPVSQLSLFGSAA